MNIIPPADGSPLARVARRFEAQALGALLKPVFGEAPKGLLSGGAAEEQWRPMLLEQHARAWTERGGIGIATAVHAELLRVQAAAQVGTEAAGGASPVAAPARPSIPRAPVPAPMLATVPAPGLQPTPMQARPLQEGARR